MNDWVDIVLHSDYGPPPLGGSESILFSMLLAFAVGHFVGFVYMWTHEAISYSRTFVMSLVVLPLIVAIMMIAMAGSILVAFGLLAVFGVVRFRNVLKDTRDTLFILWAIMEGLTVGTMRYSTSLLGALGVAAVMLYLRTTSFGTRHRYDAVLTLRVSGDLVAGNAALKQVLHQHSTRAFLASERRVTDGGVDITYRLLLRDPSRFEELQSALTQREGFGNVSVFLHDDEAEI
jgi:hypothetical protein